ncbi:sugar phosphate isomerase/epimerase family protein [Flavobacterium daejeonense]|uniref:sugar phosphate isomerase/epimerase family protein n=1 Tax=Flavobacterium daejeonense TaxID=350893 RepID=UPI00047EB81F|nr:sugar phosphate isomerase/epimerase family protein [Flavobacterium daejeonense]
MNVLNFKKNFIVVMLLLIAGTCNNLVFGQAKNKQKYKVAVCDWMILKRQKLGSFELASQIKADGIELDMGGLGNRETFDSKLADPVEVKKFKDKSKEFNVGISSIAMSGFYGQSFAKRETVKRMVQDCIDAMKTMNVKVAYLPLGNQCDLKKFPELRPVIIERLRWAGKQVAKVGGVIAVETTLDATAEKAFLKEIGCKRIKSSFNFSNAIENGKDIASELEILGKKNIAQIHASNTDGFWLENDKAINMPKIKSTLDKMNWKGWLIIERSRDTTDVYNVKRNYGANVAYLKKIFQE